MNDKYFKIAVLKGLYLIIRHLAFKQLSVDDMLDYRKKIKDDTGIDIA